MMRGVGIAPSVLCVFVGYTPRYLCKELPVFHRVTWILRDQKSWNQRLAAKYRKTKALPAPFDGLNYAKTGFSAAAMAGTLQTDLQRNLP
jgi:GH35 family endo-1,4-beta-xylanase